MDIIVTDFISMENLDRKPRVSRCQRSRASSIKSKPLNIIEEEVEPTRSRSVSPMPRPTSSNSSGEPAPALKAKRRHCNLSPSDIQIARDFVGLGDEEDVSDREDRLLLVPPTSALLRGGSPIPSPDSFQLNFTDVSFTFPHPPIPTPTSLTSRHIQSFCGSSTLDQPLTPSSSDDEFFGVASPKFNPRRAAIQPLVIRKHMSMLPEYLSASHPTQPALSPFTSEESSSSDDESDSEWYQNELSKIVSVRPPTPPPTTQKPRPDSVFISHSPSNKRISRPSGQLDPAFPKRRQSRHIPSYAPPPVPSIPTPTHLRRVSHLVPSGPLSPPSSRISFAINSPSRPPPRSSVPADFEFDDDESAFSFGLYDYQDEERSASSFQSMFSLYSSSPLDDAEFDIDMEYPMMLPLSIPGTPTDLETDIATGLEELRAARASPLPCVPEDPQETMSISDFSFSPLPRTASRGSFDSFYLASPPLSPRPAPSPPPARATPSPRFTIEDEERVLKSKWSSSTLGSIREEHRISSKLRLFSPSKKQRGSSSKVPHTPLSPMSFLTSSPSKKHQKSASPSPKPNPMPMPSGVGVRRRGSCSTVSDASSGTSASSSGSNGLRRKPIPIELFLRN